MADIAAGQDPDWFEQGRRALQGLEETWGGLAEVCFALSDTEWALPTECPGWDVRDQLSHLIGIELSIMGHPVPVWDGPFGDHVKNEVAETNERFVAVRRLVPGHVVRDEFVEVTATRLAELDSLNAAGWAEVGWSPVGQVPRAEFMDVRVYDSWVHEQDVRRALDRPGGTGNVASDISLGRVEKAMPFVVGKKAGCDDGTAVRFEVAGPGHDARAFTIAVVDGRARRVAEDVAPTVTLALSGVDFMRLGCGRVTGAEVEVAGAVGIDGDTQVGQAVLGAMNFIF